MQGSTCRHRNIHLPVSAEKDPDSQCESGSVLTADGMFERVRSVLRGLVNESVVRRVCTSDSSWRQLLEAVCSLVRL